jgi:hypothetical protein
MRTLLSATALATLLILPGAVLAQSGATGTMGTGSTTGTGGARMQGQAPAGPLPMTQPGPGTTSTSQRPSTAAGALGATSPQPGTGGTMGTQSGSMPSGTQSGAGQSGSGQPGTGQSGVMAESEVRDLLRDQGYSDVQSVSRDGNNFRARAMQNGRSVDLMVDAYTGTIRSQAAGR